jgi:hypothetical protein
MFLGLRFFAFAAYHPGVFFVILPFFVSFECFVVATLVAAPGRAGNPNRFHVFLIGTRSTALRAKAEARRAEA